MTRGKISDVFGLLKRENGPRLSIEEISELAAKGWAGELNSLLEPKDAERPEEQSSPRNSARRTRRDA